MSVGVLCGFSVVLDVYILLSPQEEEEHSYSWGGRCKHLTWLHRTFCFPLYYYTWVIHLKNKILNWEQHKRRIQLCYGPYNYIKSYFEIPFFFWEFLWISLSNLSSIKFLKICSCVLLEWLIILLTHLVCK